MAILEVTEEHHVDTSDIQLPRPVVSTPASHPGSLEFKISSRRETTLTQVFLIFISSPRQTLA
jgi:hypothetical protein